MMPSIPVNDLSRRLRAMEPELVDRAARVLASNRVILGPEVEAFEAEFAAYCGCAHAVGVANGTDALELCLRALGVGRGDPVAVVANAGGYSTAAVNAVGARPVYADVEPSTMNMAPAALEACLSAHPARAVVVTHLYGKAADMPALLGVARARGIPVVEDCAQAHGAAPGGRRVGGFGALAAFSFYPTKNLGALGDGGAVTTDDADLAAALRQLRQYGWSSRYRVGRPGGRNSRLDEVQAAFLRAFLPRLDGWNQRRRDIAARYGDLLKGTPLTLPPEPDGSHVCHLYVVRSADREGLKASLAGAGVGADVHYPVPDHWQPTSPERPSLPVTEECCGTVLTLPCFPELTDAEVDEVAAAVRAAVRA
ncbi:MAG: DegT/DnrJ/EryC1/StrS family aminotransferase [Planctomycetia bacterium]|nr:DegT/DnrJ/EryC1/StrS family aminotransferase [Planctomycetia bacterium]